LTLSGVKNKAVSSVFWSAVEVFGQQFAGALISIVIARHLSPADYGLVGILTIFIAVANVFVTAGFPSALIRKMDVEQEDYDAVFLYNVVFGIAVYLLLFLGARWIADFFGTPALEGASRLLFVTIVINSLSMIHMVVATKSLDFKSQAAISIAATLVSGSVGLTMALGGMGYWALIVQQVAAAAVRSLLFWFLVRWRPTWTFSYARISALMSYSSKLLFSGLLEVGFSNIYGVAIGKFYSAESLGYYFQAEKIKNIPLNAVNSIIQRVSLPVLSGFQDQDEVLKANYRKILRVSIYIMFPILTFLILTARPVFLLVLTDRWLPSVPIFVWLCAAGMSWGVCSLCMSILQVKGRSDIFLGLEIVKKAVIVLVFAVTFRHGALAMAEGIAASTFLAMILNMHYSGKVISYSMKEQVMDMLPYVALSSAGALVAYPVSLLHMHTSFLIALQGAIYLGVFLGLSVKLNLEAYRTLHGVLATRFDAWRGVTA